MQNKHLKKYIDIRCVMSNCSKAFFIPRNQCFFCFFLNKKNWGGVVFSKTRHIYQDFSLEVHVGLYAMDFLASDISGTSGKGKAVMKL